MAVSQLASSTTSAIDKYEFKVTGIGQMFELTFSTALPPDSYYIEWSLVSNDNRQVKVYALDAANTVITSTTVNSPLASITSASPIKKISLKSLGTAWAGANGLVTVRKAAHTSATYTNAGALVAGTSSNFTYQWEGAHGFIKGTTNAAFYAAGSTNLNTSGNNSAVQKYDPTTGVVSLVASGTTRDELNSANTGTNTCFYIVRGTRNDTWANLTAEINEYTASTNTWATKASSPESGGGNGLAVSGSDGKIYYGGGYNGGTDSASFYVYDPATNTHTLKAVLPTTAVRSAGSTSIDGVIYVFGDSNANGWTYKYTIATNTWTRLTDLPVGQTPVYNGGANAISATQIAYYVYSTTASARHTYDYNPSTNTHTRRTGAEFAYEHYKGGFFLYNGEEYAWLGNNVASGGAIVEKLTSNTIPAYAV